MPGVDLLHHDLLVFGRLVSSRLLVLVKKLYHIIGEGGTQLGEKPRLLVFLQQEL
jgi:hypothetical protein